MKIKRPLAVICEEPLFVKLTSAIVYFLSARASAGETIQVPHMRIVIDIEAVITKDSFLSTKKPGEESRLQNRLVFDLGTV